VGKSPHKQHIIISATWLARRANVTVAEQRRMMYQGTLKRARYDRRNKNAGS
jgi:hypothetical protein